MENPMAEVQSENQAKVNGAFFRRFGLRSPRHSKTFSPKKGTPLDCRSKNQLHYDTTNYQKLKNASLRLGGLLSQGACHSGVFLPKALPLPSHVSRMGGTEGGREGF